jgi:diaminopimelate decarboxylase
MLLDEQGIRAQCRDFLRAAKSAFGPDARVLYASKALCFAGLYKVLQSENIGADVVSAGEMHTARAGGFDLANACFHGNYKSDAEISYAVAHGIGTIVIDNFEECARIDAAAGAAGVRQKVLIRLTPGVESDTHKAVVTGHAGSKFGALISDGTAEKLTRHVLAFSHLELTGFHCHIGSQIFDTDPYCRAAEVMLSFIADMKQKTGFAATELNLGGGFGVRYVKEQPEQDPAKTIEQIGKTVDVWVKKLKIQKPRMTIEPGRSLVAAYGLTVYTVGAVKSTPAKNFVIADGGMTDNPRFALYNAPYTVLPVNVVDDKKRNVSSSPASAYLFDLAGRTCESGDIIAANVRFETAPRAGDLIAVTCTGAYNYSMASNYNRLPRPAVVIVSAEGERVAVQRETAEDLIRKDLEIENI